MMKLLILGATGGTGLELVKQAVERGHKVTALVRAPQGLAALGVTASQVEVVSGTPLSSADIAESARGKDAVLSAFGSRSPREKSTLMESFARAVVDGMSAARVRRLVDESIAFLFEDAIVPPAGLLGRLLLPHYITDNAKMENIVQHSGLEWTIVRPPQLTDGKRTKSYRVRDGHLPPFGFFISRADVADFMLDAVEDRSSIGKIYGICR